MGIPSQLADDELMAEVKILAGRERRATADLIVHLAELDVRELFLGAGFRSAIPAGGRGSGPDGAGDHSAGAGPL